MTSSNLPSIGNLNPSDPAGIGLYPATLPMEIALRESKVPEILAAYDISEEQWEEVRNNPGFISDLNAATEALKKEGVSFRAKAKLQAEGLLRTSWEMIHDTSGNVPAAVKYQLIALTLKAAGYSEDKTAGVQQTGLSININLSGGDK